ncbi:hypothetical protein [Escherichia coli]|uniref:hypothetical protein n=1 Tax=Escherichia coli TaxID=562 RepID=UPI00092A2421|nr:hypothetical protein [Escherichia coli]EHU7964215.1 hypothetical protein [Escherichia coli]MBN7749316.1 hypothetical protein [Escherichia coli]MCE3517824.1 hypothetical protein [Escherichia coli]MCS1027601.1 hypothetical protein [Escherichia coli]MDM8893047.1 hypothetical protein [Escherichia coli]
MLQIVGALILLIAGFAILRLLFRALISTASALAGLILLCLFGPALLAGYITERITRLFHIRWLAGVFLTIAGMIISFMWGLDGKHIALEAHTFDSVKFILTTALAGGLLAVPLQIKNIQQNGITPEDISKEINGYYCCFYTAFFLMACSACAPLIALQYDISPSLMWWGGLLYWLAALVTLLWAASQIQALKKLTCAISQTLEEQPVLNSKSWLTSLQNDYSLPDSLTERIWLTLISQRISRGELREFELADGNWLLNNAWYERNMAGFNEQLKENLSFTPDELKTLFRNRLNLSPEANDDFLDRCLDGGAARSVGAAFDGQNGQYRYMGNNGPMQLEVPRDQYAGAVETMRNKIREGKVPGVTDPAEASRLIRRGHLTYTQARNITRFGTIESVTYDIAEGSVVSLAAGGISFALTASVFWLSTGDRNAALQTAAVQAGKTFTRTLAVYVTTQQLHRLSVVQGMLKHIDFSTASPTVRLALQKGTGAGNISALNKVMKGTLVTSLALVAVTTGPDMIKMLRGRISGAQFIRNLAVASSGVAGGAVGSVAGGILFSPLGPFGALTGRVVGGVLGGMIASAVSGKIAGALVEEDRVKILAMIQEQVTWLAGSFLLTGHEIENLNENLARVIDQNALEIIFAAGIQQRAATNMLIKPLVVSIIRQRPVMEYDASHLGNMVNRLEEALPPELPA